VDIPSAARRLTDLPRQGLSVALGTPQELARLWSEAERLLGRAGRLLERAELLVDRLESQLVEADGLLDHGRLVAKRAETVATDVADTRAATEAQVRRVQRIIDRYEPVLERLVPVAAEAAATVRPSHLGGVVTLLEELPSLVDRFEPALASMASLTPEMEEVSERMDNVGEIVEGMPGAKLLRRRGKAREEEAGQEGRSEPGRGQPGRGVRR
jgi:hypothetical protein